MKAHEIYQQIHIAKNVIADLQELINHVNARRQVYHANTLSLLEHTRDCEERILENLSNQDFNQ